MVQFLGGIPIIKSAILAARFSGTAHKRSLKRLSKMDIDDKDKELLFMRDKVNQQQIQITILQIGTLPQRTLLVNWGIITSDQVSVICSDNMMQSVKNWLAYDLTIFLNWSMYRRIFLKRHMCSADIVILKDIFMQDIIQMFFVENNHIVKTVSTKRTDYAFTKRILPR